MKLTLLRLVLLVRCVGCLLFAWALHGATPSTLAGLAEWFEPFAIVDGTLGLALAPLMLAVSWGPGVAAVALLDGVLSVGWGAVLYWWPGIPGFPVSAVLFSGLLSALSGLIGVFQLTLAVQLRRRSGSTVLGLALGGLGVAFVVLAILDFSVDVTPSALQTLLVAQAGLQGVAFGVLALASGRGREWMEVRPRGAARAERRAV
jgi:hypothetical protein